MAILSQSNFASDDEKNTFNKIATRILPFLLILYIVAFLDRINVSFAKLSMAADIGMGDAAYGLGAGIFFIAFCLFEIPSNLLLQRVGAKFWIARIMVTWGIVCVAMAWTTSPSMFYLLRFLLGVAEAGFYPGIILYLSYWFPPQLRGQATALFVLGIPLAGAIGAPVCGLIMAHMGSVGFLKDWQWLFVLTGVPATALGVMTYFYLDDNPDKAKWLTDSEKKVIASRFERELSTNKKALQSHRLRDGFMHPSLWLLAFINFSVIVSLYALSFWLPQIVKNLGVVDAFQNGVVVAIPSAVAAIVMLYVARHSDRHGERRWHTAGSSCVAALGMAISTFYVQNGWISILGLSMAMAGLLTAFTIIFTLPNLIVSGSAAAAGIALLTTIGNFGGYVGPFMTGWIKQTTGHIEYALLLCGVLLFAGAIVTLWLPGLRKDAQHDDSGLTRDAAA